MTFSIIAVVAGKNCWADSNYVWKELVWKKIVENSEVLVLLLLLAVNTESWSIVCTKLCEVVMRIRL